MVTISSFNPVDYIDSEAVALEYLSLARSFGNADLLASALKDVDAAHTTWGHSTQIVEETPDHSSSANDDLKN